MVFVLDNYDSFTYNLVQYMGELGAEMVIRRNDELTPAEVEALRPDRILISPGPVHAAGGGHLHRPHPALRRQGEAQASRSSASVSATSPSARPSAATSSAPPS